MYQLHGCYFHGCRKCFPTGRGDDIDVNGFTLEDCRRETEKRTKQLRAAGCRVQEMWQCFVGPLRSDLCPKPFTKIFPYAILYDF